MGVGEASRYCALLIRWTAAIAYDSNSFLYFVLHSSNSFWFISMKILTALYIRPWIVLGKEKVLYMVP